MHISLTAGIGAGPTKLAAFDAALNDAGIANYNLIRLSSVIPPLSTVEPAPSEGKATVAGQWGDRLYVVIAERRVSTPGQQAWAGIGWVQDKATRRGLFVEHDGNDELSVRDDIQQSLKALMVLREIDLGRAHEQVIGTVCHGQPVCALVAAVYGAEPWFDSSQRVGKS